MSRAENTYGYDHEDWLRLPWRLRRALENARTPDERVLAHDDVRAYLDALNRGEAPPLERGLKPLILRTPTRDAKPDVIVCECGAAVSWAVYLDHHGCKAREPDPTEDTTEEVECECGQIVLGAGWLPFHRGGRCHKDRMARKAAIARAFVVRPIDWYWCDECGSQVHTWDREGHRARMHSDATGAAASHALDDGACPGVGAPPSAQPSLLWTVEVTPRERIFADIDAERARQDAKWGAQNHPMVGNPHESLEAQYGPGSRYEAKSAGVIECMRLGIPSEREARERCDAEHRSGRGTFASILVEELAEWVAASVIHGDTSGEARKELVQVVAVGVAALERIDRLQSPASGPLPPRTPLPLTSGVSAAREPGDENR